VLVWALSPAGGQGALRALNVRQNTTTFENPLSIYPINNLSVFSDGPFSSASGGASSLNQSRAPIGAVFTAQDVSLMQANSLTRQFDAAVRRFGGVAAASKMTKRDLWRNLRIPFLHRLPASGKTSSGWNTVPDDVISDYSSLIGIPIRGFPVA
jgi:hypothetical protein